VELATQSEGFARRGIAVASVIPEPTETLAAFAAAHRLPFPLLSDPGAAVVARAGVLDPGSVAGQPVPYAGSILLDAQGRVTAKYFEADTEYRRTAASILSLAGDATAGETLATPHFGARRWQSGASIAPGQTLTVGIDLELPEGLHAYAPGARGYRGLDLVVEGEPLFEPGALHVPPPRLLFFAPTNESVPVVEGRVRVARDLTQRFRAALPRLRDAPEIRTSLEGALLYQVCSDRVCHPPGRLPLRFEVAIRPWTR
jgi:hypothetical protein